MKYKFKISILINFVFVFILVNCFCFNESKAENDNSIPNINARHAVVLERNTGMILFGKNENEKCKMASTTKIMTAIVVIENTSNLKEKVIISKRTASTGGSRLGLTQNDEITIQDLLYGLMMVSRK